jgi:hypothetical protein
MSSFSLKGGGWYADGYASVKPGLASTERNTSKTEKKNGQATSNTTDRSDTGAASSASPPAA